MKVRTAKELMKENMLVKHYAGSLAYGTNLPTSDVDFRGVFCADPVNVRTPFYTVRQSTDETEEDTMLYELSHFMKLCLDCNPNVVETLWVAEKDLTYRTPAYDLLRNSRHRLLSAKLAFTFSGYALSQLKRIKGHNKWINSPQPEERPRQTQFVSMIQWFGAAKVMPRDFKVEIFRDDHRFIPYGNDLYAIYYEPGYQLFADDFSLNTVFDGDRPSAPPLAIVKFNKAEYKLALEKHGQYWSWKNNRNEARGKLEEEFGYDTKHAMHLVRLLRMGVEALRDGEIIVKRPDADELLAIRKGAWTYEEIVEYATSMDNDVRDIWYHKTDLRKKPDINFAAELLMEVQDLVWQRTKELYGLS